MSRLNEKVVIIIGASSGIGETTAHLLAEIVEFNLFFI